MKKISLLTVLFVMFSAAAFAGNGKQCSSAAKFASYKDCNSDVQACVNNLTAKYANKAWLGIKGEKAEYGKKIVAVVPGSPAEAAGFQKGDVLVAVNGVALTAAKSELKAMKKTLAAGSMAKYKVVRDGKKVVLKATLVNPPAEIVAAWVSDHIKNSKMTAGQEVAAN